jgi:predicted phosphodiesterase
MRVAVISDIHANAHALDAVLEAVAPYDRLWVLGDIVGYGPHPDGVVERLVAEGAIAVQGNHDAAVLGRIPTSTFNDLARAAVEWTAGTISTATRDWLAAQPDRREEGAFTLVHGSPRDPLWEYLLSIPVARLNLGAFATDHCLVGHTHIPIAFRDEDGRIAVIRAPDGSRLGLDGRHTILNPGSVGQPRDGDPRAGVMLIDTETGDVGWRRVAYPAEATRRAMRELPLPRALGDRLLRGR